MLKHSTGATYRNISLGTHGPAAWLYSGVSKFSFFHSSNPGRIESEGTSDMAIVDYAVSILCIFFVRTQLKELQSLVKFKAGLFFFLKISSFKMSSYYHIWFPRKKKTTLWYGFYACTYLSHITVQKLCLSQTVINLVFCHVLYRGETMMPMTDVTFGLFCFVFFWSIIL